METDFLLQFLENMSKLGDVVVAARNWRDTEGTDERALSGIALYEALNDLDEYLARSNDRRACPLCGRPQISTGLVWIHIARADMDLCNATHPLPGANLL